MSNLATIVKKKMDELGLNPTSAAAKAGLGKDFVRDIIRGKKTSISLAGAAKLAPVLECSVDVLMGGAGDSSAAMVEDHAESFGILYGGIVEAGAFRPADGLNQVGPTRIINLPPDPRYPASAQFAFEVIGDSMNLAHIEPGMWVQAVQSHAWERIHGQPGDGKLVIVTRIRDDGAEHELTIKRLRIFRDRIELRPESSNPVHKPIVWPNPPVEGPVEASVTAVVLASMWLYP